MRSNVELAERQVLSTPKALVALYLAAIATAEAVLAFVSVHAGLIIEAVVLTALVNHYTFSVRSDPGVRNTLAVLALIPLTRLATFVLPQAELSTVYWEALILVPVLLGIALTSELVDTNWLKLGRGRSSWWVQGLIALSGVVLSAALVQSGLDREMDEVESGSLVVQAAVVFFISGVTIEVLYRGLVQSALTAVFGRAGIALAAGAFGMLVLGTGSAAYVILATALGVGFGVVTERTGSVVGVATAHGVLNVGATIVWPRFL
jgi:membrane protease YdiL (CAAX protease family)